MNTGRRRAWALVGSLGVAAALLGAAVVVARADSVKTEIELSTKDVSSKQVPFGGIIADAIRASAKADIALIAASFFSDSEVTIPKGNFDSAEVLRGLEFKDNKIAVLKLKGDQIRRALDYAFFLYPKANSSFLQYSGLTVTMDADNKIKSVKVGDDALENGKTYKVAMPISLANGALSYFKFWKKSDIDKETDKTLKEVVANYLSSHKTITKNDDRLIAKAKS